MQPNWTTLFSDNIKSYEGYSIGKLFKLLKDPELISLAGGLPSPEVFLKTEMRNASSVCLEKDIEKVMQYSEISGEDSLVESVIEFLRNDGIHLSAENIVITSSGQQGLDLAGRLFLDPGDAVLLDRPTFAGAIVAFQMQRPVFAGVNIRRDGSDIDGFQNRIEQLRSAGRTPKFIYVVSDFQNPSGITMSLEKRRALLDLSYRHDIPIVEDSPYRDLRYFGEGLPSIFGLDQEQNGGHVFGVYTFSKLFCPGMRVGFNIGPKEVIEKMTNIKEGSTLNTPKYNQDMCTQFLNAMDWKAHIMNCREYYREKLALILQTLDSCFPENSGVTWTKPEGGLFLWLSVPSRINTYDLFHKALTYKVAFVPGQVFYGENPEKNHMRINFSYPSQNDLVEGIKRLAECIRAAI
ncbi:MAG: PLP-dependent aminotransferase family protein [Deltaproteobacteria bacterium]|jgi:2-aminoadipate transaminase|nr:PLP-dependent aminotransferase family protein [Deltaproteobacteria bacterium]